MTILKIFEMVECGLPITRRSKGGFRLFTIELYQDELMKFTCSSRFAVAEINSELVCIRFDPSFYKQVCDDFIAVTAFEDGYDILDYCLNFEDDIIKKGQGFPNWICGYTLHSFFEVFHVGLDGGGLKPKPFEFGEVIPPLLIDVLRNLGYNALKSVSIDLENCQINMQCIF